VAYRIRWSPEELAAAEEPLCKLPGPYTETTWILPMQVRYVIGRGGVIAYANINADYRQPAGSRAPDAAIGSDNERPVLAAPSMKPRYRQDRAARMPAPIAGLQRAYFRALIWFERLSAICRHGEFLSAQDSLKAT